MKRSTACAGSSSMEAVLKAATTLATILAAENDALAVRDSEAVHATVGKKLETVEALEAAMSALADDLARSREVDEPQMHGQLKAIAAHLASLINENEFRLAVARAAQRLVLDQIAKAATEVTAGPGTYACDGRVWRSKSEAAHPLAVTLDRAL